MLYLGKNGSKDDSGIQENIIPKKWQVSSTERIEELLLSSGEKVLENQADDSNEKIEDLINKFDD